MTKTTETKTPTGSLRRFTLVATVTDPVALHAAAAANCIERNMGEIETEDAIGTAAQPDIDGCLTMLLDPIEPIPGIQVEASGSGLAETTVAAAPDAKPKVSSRSRRS